MSLSTFLTDLDAARVRFRQLLAGKNITVGNGATIIDCLDLLADYWNVAAPVVTPGSLDLYMYYNGSKYLLGSGVNADFSDAIGNYYGSGYAIVSGVLGKITNGGFAALQIENNTGWSKLGGGSNQAYGIRNGKLYAVYSSNVVQVGSDSGWTDIDKPLFQASFTVGIRDGQLYLVEGSSAARISESSGWRIVIGHPAAVADSSGKLYMATANGPVLKSELQGWTHLTGFSSEDTTGNGAHHTTHYGICAGKLYFAESDGSFVQIGISDQWSCISREHYVRREEGSNYAYEPLAICNGQLYSVGFDEANLLDSSTGYTDCWGYGYFSENKISGFAIRNSRIVGINVWAENAIVEISARSIFQICSGNDAMVCFLEASAEADNRPATTKLTLTAPDDLGLYANGYAGINTDSHYWSDDDVLTVKVLRGNTVLTTSCTGYNGVDFETNSLSHLCAGNRVLVDVGSKPEGLAETELTIQWLRGETVVKTETRTFDWKHTPQYFTRPAGEGNYSLKIGGSAVSAEVYYGGEWIDFPSGVLTAQYAGHEVRTKTATALDAIACWSNEGADGDNFWYLT